MRKLKNISDVLVISDKTTKGNEVNDKSLRFYSAYIPELYKVLTGLVLCVINEYMKQTQNNYQDELINIYTTNKLLKEKVRINLYLPKIIVRLIDSLTKNSSRGEFVSNLVIEKIKKTKKLPYGMFSPLEISKKDIDNALYEELST